jgi:hypothetical protein
MVDGTGNVRRLPVKVGGKIKFACVDGPDFDGHQVDFDDLMSRLRRFTQDEGAAAERWSETCRMSGQADAKALGRPSTESDGAPRPVRRSAWRLSRGQEEDDPDDPAGSARRCASRTRARARATSRK